MDRPIAVAIASRAQLGPAAQRAAASMPDLRAALAENTAVELDKALWFTLYKLKPKPVAVALASALAARKLDDDQLDHVLADPRVAPMKRALTYNELSPERLRVLLTTTHGEDVAKLVLELSYVTDPVLKFELQQKAGGLELLSALSGRPDDEVIDHLGRWDAWAPGPSRARASELSALLFERPAVVSWCANSGVVPLVSVACGSRHLRSLDDQLAVLAFAKSLTGPAADDMAWGLLRLVNLPACRLDIVAQIEAWTTSEKLRDSAKRRLAAAADKPFLADAYEDVSDASVLEWLCRRALPNRFDEAGKPAEVYALAFNPHLTADQASSVMVALASHAVAGTIGYDNADRALETLRVAQGSPPAEPYWSKWQANDVASASRIAVRQRYSTQTGFDDTTADASVRELAGWRSGGMLEWLVANVDDDEDTWRAVLGLADQNLEITLEELALIAAAS